MTKKVEKSGFRSILHWLLWVCSDELRFDLNRSRKNIPLFLCKCDTYYYLIVTFLALGSVVKQVWVLIDLSDIFPWIHPGADAALMLVSQPLPCRVLWQMTGVRLPVRLRQQASLFSEECCRSHWVPSFWLEGQKGWGAHVRCRERAKHPHRASVLPIPIVSCSFKLQAGKA